MDHPGDNRRTAVAFIEALARHDWTAAVELCDENVEWHVPGPPELIPVAGVHRGRDGITRFLTKAVQEFGVSSSKPDLQIKRVTSEEDRVVIEHEVRACTATGQNYHNYYSLSFELENGKIHRIREYVDTLYAWHRGMFRRS